MQIAIVADPGFPRRGSPTPKVGALTYYIIWPDFSQKLHERNSTQRGTRVPGAPYIDPPMIYMSEQGRSGRSGFSFLTQIWHFCTKFTSRVLKSFKKKLPPVGFDSNHHWIRILTVLPTQPPRHLLNRKSLNWSWIISRINRAWLHKGLKIWDCHGLTDFLSG